MKQAAPTCQTWRCPVAVVRGAMQERALGDPRFQAMAERALGRPAHVVHVAGQSRGGRRLNCLRLEVYDTGDFWPAFAGQADYIHDNAGPNQELVWGAYQCDACCAWLPGPSGGHRSRVVAKQGLTDTMTLHPHPSLKNLAQECQEWLEHAQAKGKAEKVEAAIKKFLDMPGELDQRAGLQLERLALYLDVASCDAFFRSDTTGLSRLIQHAVQLRALVFRWDGMYSDMRQDLGNWPKEFSDSMKAMGPSMLSRWGEASTCAQLYIEMVEKDQRINTMPEMRKVKNSTSDVFAVELFSTEFKLPTNFEPLNPLIPEYRALLDTWQTDDELKFQAVMQMAADFHVSRSKENTDRTRYEFDATIDRVFPAELLAIQALRRKHHLPDFDADHALIDEPWKVLREIKSVDVHPLAKAVEERLITDYPQFR